MGMYIFASAVASFLATALVIFLYIRSSFILLDLVKQDEAVWGQLDCPDRHYIRDGATRALTVRPLFPWLGWIWLGDPQGVSQPIASRLLTTSKLLRLGLVMFVVVSLVLPPVLLLWS